MNTTHKWTRKLIGITLAAVVSISGLLPAAKAAAADGPPVEASSAMLLDAKSGQVLFAKNENEKRYPASTTKLMVLLLAYEAVQKGQKKMTDIVPVPKEAYNIEGSSVWLDPKEQFPLQDMLKFIAVPSGNDASTSTAIFLAGSEQAFVDQMNKKAQELGMKGTHFANSNGLHNPDHYTTAADMAILARELVTKYPQVLEISSIQSFEMRGGQNKIENTNHLIGKYEGMTGLKTGFTDEAGYCLISTAQRGDLSLLGIVLHSNTDAGRVSDTRALLDYGFGNFKSKRVAEKDKPLAEKATIANAKSTEVEVAPANDLYVAVKNGQEQGVQTKIEWKQVEAPVSKGTVLGQLQQVQNGKVLSSVNLVATQDVEKGSWLRLFFRNMFGGIKNALSSLF